MWNEILHNLHKKILSFLLVAPIHVYSFGYYLSSYLPFSLFHLFCLIQHYFICFLLLLTNIRIFFDSCQEVKSITQAFEAIAWWLTLLDIHMYITVVIVVDKILTKPKKKTKKLIQKLFLRKTEKQKKFKIIDSVNKSLKKFKKIKKY